MNIQPLAERQVTRALERYWERLSVAHARGDSPSEEELLGAAFLEAYLHGLEDGARLSQSTR